MAYTDPEFDKEYQRCYHRLYRAKHKVSLNKQRRENKIKTTCECGSVVQSNVFIKHLQSLKHQEYEFLKINDE
jgi:hypothetical protein